MFSKELNEPYQNTRYICLDPGVELQCGKANTELDARLFDKGVQQLCILSAYNPHSVLQPEDLNERNHKQLVEELTGKKYELWEGVNKAVDEDFPEERSIWVLEMTWEDGHDWAVEWDQNAYIYFRRGGVAELIWCKSIHK